MNFNYIFKLSTPVYGPLLSWCQFWHFSKQAWRELSPLFEKAPEIKITRWLKFDLVYENQAKFVATTIEFTLAICFTDFVRLNSALTS
ncbi:MAG: hypothetical protein ACTTJC_09060 [Campylobacter sp.]